MPGIFRRLLGPILLFLMMFTAQSAHASWEDYYCWNENHCASYSSCSTPCVMNQQEYESDQWRTCAESQCACIQITGYLGREVLSWGGEYVCTYRDIYLIHDDCTSQDGCQIDTYWSNDPERCYDDNPDCPYD
jgi:hypothetical protein